MFQEEEERENGLIDPAVLQGVQDRFCKAFHVYMFCVGKEQKRITSFYGSQEEIDFLDVITDQNAMEAISTSLKSQNVSGVTEMDGSRSYLKHYILPISISGNVQMTWVITALLEENMTGLEELPEGKQREKLQKVADNLQKTLED